MKVQHEIIRKVCVKMTQITRPDTFPRRAINRLAIKFQNIPSKVKKGTYLKLVLGSGKRKVGLSPSKYENQPILLPFIGKVGMGVIPQGKELISNSVKGGVE